MPARPIDIPTMLTPRFARTFRRAFAMRCPYCGSRAIFAGPMTLKDRCPGCNTLFAYEDGYFLGAYAINLIFFILFGIALVVGLITLTDLSVLQMQILGGGIVVVLPILMYPLTLLLWIALDLTLHPPGDFSERPRT